MNQSILVLDNETLHAGQIRDLIKARALSESTWRVMLFQWKKFIRWGGKLSATPEMVCDYLTHLAKTGIKTSGLESAKWAIDQVHRLKQIPEPARDASVKSHLKGLKRILADESPAQVRTNEKQPITIIEIRKLSFPDDMRGTRNKALMLAGFASGMRRSELSALKKKDIELTEFGMRIKIWKSKSNQEGLCETVEVLKATKGDNLEHCPVKALINLLDTLDGEYVFQSLVGKGRSSRFSGKALSGISIGQIIKSYGQQLGLEASACGGHSLRAGLATYLLSQDVQPAAVQKQLRHKRFDTTQRYNRGETARALTGAY